MAKLKNSPQVTRTKEGKLVLWKHPGGKLLRLGPDSLSDSELIAILIGSGVPGKSAETISGELLSRFRSFRGMANQPLEELEKFKGLKRVKAVRIAAAFEIAKRIVKEVMSEK